jgi:hypothetical protein
MLSLAFGISIRIGGILIFAYLVLFSSLWVYFIFQSGMLKWSISWLAKFAAILIAIFVFAYALGILLWPWALEAPISNPLESLALMNSLSHNRAADFRRQIVLVRPVSMVLPFQIFAHHAAASSFAGYWCLFTVLAE